MMSSLEVKGTTLFKEMKVMTNSTVVLAMMSSMETLGVMNYTVKEVRILST